MCWVRYWGRCIGLGILGLGCVYSGLITVAHSAHTHNLSGFNVILVLPQYGHRLAMCDFSFFV